MHACMRACMCVCVVCAYGDAWGVGPYEEHRSSSQEHCPLLRQCLSWWSAAHQWSWAWLPGPCGFCLPISGVIRTYQPAHPFCLGPEDGTRSLSLSLQSKFFAERTIKPHPHQTPKHNALYFTGMTKEQTVKEVLYPSHRSVQGMSRNFTSLTTLCPGLLSLV